MKKKIHVCFLPVAGKDCPHQWLTMAGAAQNGRYEIRHGVQARFFPGVRTCLKYRPNILYFDWIEGYYGGRFWLITLAKMVSFLIDVQIVTKIFRRPIVWTIHNLRSHEQRLPDAWERFMQRYFARHATRIRVFARDSIERVIARLGVDRDKLCVIPEGNYIDYYPNKISGSAARARLDLGTDDFVLLWLGSIRPYKGLQELIEAFKKIAGPEWRLIIAGKPYIKSYAKDIIELARTDGRIHLHTRFIPEDELQVFYNAADAVVLPFAEIENSASLNVAMGFRKAVVAPKLGVVAERLCRQPELVYEPDALVGTLQKLAALAPTRLVEIGQANFEEVSKYKWTDLVKLFDAVIPPIS